VERGSHKEVEAAPAIGDEAFFEIIPGETYAALYVRKGDDGFEVQIFEPQGTTMTVADKEAREKVLAGSALGRL
jgi:hypothetical protein